MNGLLDVGGAVVPWVREVELVLAVEDSDALFADLLACIEEHWLGDTGCGDRYVVVADKSVAVYPIHSARKALSDGDHSKVQATSTRNIFIRTTSFQPKKFPCSSPAICVQQPALFLPK